MEYNGNNAEVKKLKSVFGTWLAYAIVFTVLGIAFTIGWMTRGLHISEFTGVGEAEILTMDYISRGYGDRSDDVYVFDVRIKAGEETFIRKERRRDKPSWYVGDIVTVTYNVNNPREYVIGKDPESYSRWYKNIGIVTLVLIIGGVLCFCKCLKIYCLQKQTIEEQNQYGFYV